MADEKKTEEKSTEEKKKRKLPSIKLLIIIFVLLAGFSVGGYFAYNKFLKKKPPEVAEEQTPAEQPAAMKGVSVGMESFLVNLADPLGRRYLKLTLEVELADAKAVEMFEMSRPKLRDAILLLLSSKTYDSLSSEADKLQLKMEIVERMNQVLGGSVLQVYYTEFVVQ